jgi:hypothetical protein
MLFGNRRPRKSDARRRTPVIDRQHRPRGEELEDRVLLAIDLGGTSPPSNPLIATAPFGMAFGGSNPTTITQGAGWSVSDLGDVNGDGFDDFMIGAPTVTSSLALGSGIGSEAYLVFGSKTVNAASVTDWIGKNASGAFNYTANDRVGDLGQLGAATQTNPITGSTLDFPFAGITFTTTLGITSGLGASVASVKIGSTYGILIGAPFGPDLNGANLGTGRAYLITGSFNNFIGQTINLDTAPPTGLNVVTFVNNATGGQLGFSVASGSNIFGQGESDIILGAPLATFGATGGTGAVYAFSTAFFGTGTQMANVATVGQSGTTSAVFTGATSGSQAGWSVADGGDVNGAAGNVDDLLIGAPSYLGSGAAYLIYGGSTLAGLAQTVNGVRFINLANVGAASGTTRAVPGATIVGPGGSLTGWAVSAGGDFDTDGFGDILIGSPDFTTPSATNIGLASLLYGAPSTSGAYLTGTITLLSPPTGVRSLLMVGSAAGSLAGYSLSQVGFINAGEPSLILIGSPGFNNNNGTAYLIPGRAGGLTGTQTLTNAQSSPLSGLQFLLTTPSAPSGSPPFFGASVSSRFPTPAPTVTADSDSKEDFIIGAPGYDVTQTAARALAGGAMIVQGGLINVPIPGVQQIVTTIGVGTPFAPFSINASTPANLQIYVFGTTTPNGTFEPVRDINPATVVVNGVAFPNATLLADPNMADWVNGIQDAIITITPRSALGLTAGTATITISGKTLSTSPLAGETWTGSASVAVTGSSSGGSSSSLLAGVAGGPVLETTFNSPFGPDQYVPTISQLSAYNYAPIPLTVALQQYQPASGFNDRLYNWNHPTKHLKNYLTIRGPAATGIWGSGSGSPGPSGLDYRGRNFRTFINNQILDRSRFHEGRSYIWTHKAYSIGSIHYKGVVPVQLTTQHVAVVPGVKAAGNRQIGRPHSGGGTFRFINGDGLGRGGGGIN